MQERRVGQDAANGLAAIGGRLARIEGKLDTLIQIVPGIPGPWRWLTTIVAALACGASASAAAVITLWLVAAA